MVTLTINQREVKVPEGATILTAAGELGIGIPTLCAWPEIHHTPGACRVCVVEIEGARSLVASCVMPVAEGMKVMTNTARVREARRMVSDYVMTEHNCRGQQKAEDPVGLGAYGMDSHNCQRIVKGGHAENEGDVEVGVSAPYPISYRSIVPKAGECENLLVPICLSATHIAYGSIRMEPVFMILGQSAATAAVLAMESNCSVQKLRYESLRARLLADKQVLEWTARAPAPTGKAKRAKR